MLKKSFVAIAAPIIAPIIGVFFAAAPTLAPAQDQGVTVKATHGAWEIRCATEDPKRCLMAQTGNNTEGQPVIQTIVRRTPDLKGPNGEAIAALVEVIAPIGVFLPAGVAIKIDGREVGRGVYRVCNPQACLVQEPVPDTFISAMKKGSNAVMTIAGSNGKTTDITISLSGFTKAYNGL